MGIRGDAKAGMPIARVAMRYGVSRQTVYNVMGIEVGGVVERAARPSLLDPFRGHIRARLERYDLPATTLLGELRTLGYGVALAF